MFLRISAGTFQERLSATLIRNAYQTGHHTAVPLRPCFPSHTSPLPFADSRVMPVLRKAPLPSVFRRRYICRLSLVLFCSLFNKQQQQNKNKEASDWIHSVDF